MRWQIRPRRKPERTGCLPVIVWFSLTWLSFFVAHVEADAPDLQRFEYERAEMGVPFHITLYAVNEDIAKSAVDAAFQRIGILNAIFSDYDSDSELSKLSQSSGSGQAIPLSDDLLNVLILSQSIAEHSGGAFDVTIGPLVSLWRRARQKKELPSNTLITTMRERVGFHYLILDPVKKTAKLTHPDMRLDLGGIAKGYAVDAALKVLDAYGIHSALVAASGDIGATDAPPGKPGWRIEVAPLDAPDAPPARFVLLRHSAVSTSGDTYQRVEINGVRYSHVIDPATGLGKTDHSLTTVIGPDCTTTDSLETTVSLLGPERGIALIESTPGTAVFLVRKPGDHVESFTSKRWDELSTQEH